MELSAFAAWLNTALAGFDHSVSSTSLSLHDNFSFILQPLSILMHYLGKGGIALIALSIILIFFPRTRKTGTAMLLALGIGALITNLALKPTVCRPRPYTYEDSVFYQLWQLSGGHTESDFSFPSGHTTAAFASMTALFLVTPRRKSWPALLFAVLMGLSRIYLGVHYPSDVLGGVVCGLAGAIAAYYLIRLIPQGFYEWKPGKNKKQ